MAGFLRMFREREPLVLSAVALLSVNSTASLLARLTNDRKAKDIGTTASFAISAATTFGFLVRKCSERGEGLPLRPLIATAAVTIWGVRLGLFLSQRQQLLEETEEENTETGDYRLSLSEQAQNILPGEFPPRYGEEYGGFLAQSAWSWVVLLPVSLSSRFPPANSPLDLVSALSVGGCVAGVAIAAVADAQKMKSKRVKGQEGMWCERGLWYYSRHPNHFGEAVFWASLYTVAAKDTPTWAAASPLFVLLWIYNVTVNHLEQRYDNKFMASHDYSRYKWDTSLLVPWPKSRANLAKTNSTNSLQSGPLA